MLNELRDQAGRRAAEVAEPRAEVTEAPPAEAEAEPGSQLANLIATRDALTAKTNPTRQDAIKLRAVENQIKQLQAKTQRAAPVTQDTATAFMPRGTYAPKDFDHYKFNNGTSVYRSVFEAAGHDPNLAVNKPLAWQNKVLSDHLKNTAGFRDVTVQPGTNPMFARDSMLDLARATQDMANALGMRHALTSLDGRLALSIEPRGKRSYLGAYNGGTKTIHLVNDANSFGHEWIHAVDHLLTEQLLANPQQQNLLSRHTRAGELDTSDGTQAAFARLINTMFYDQGAEALHRIDLEQKAALRDKAGNPTKAAQEAQRNLDALNKGASKQRIQPSTFRAMAAQFGKPDYWASAHEMLARSGESWIARQMENNGVDPRGVVAPDEAYLNTTDKRLAMTFPKDAERVAIFSAFNDLFDRLKNDGIITGPTAPKADFPAATIAWSRQTTPAARATGLGQAVRRELNGLSAGVKKLLHPMRELTGADLRPPAPSTLPRKTRAADIARTFLYSYGAHMKVIIARNPGAGGKALQALYDKLNTDPGSGRAVGETFFEEHRAMDNILRNKMGRVYENNGYGSADQMSALEARMIHHVMTTGEATYQNERVPPNLQRIAGQLQNELLNPLYRELTNAGHEVGVAPNGYFPRIYDEPAVFADPDGFKKAAASVYKLMFDRDVGNAGDNPVKLLERWTTLTKAERALADPSLPAAMKELRKNLREQAKTRAALEASPGDAALQAKLDQLTAEAKQLATDNHDPVGDHIAEIGANDWANRIIEGDPLDFETMGPSGRFLNARKLPPEADQLMEKYMHTDPRVALPRYFDSVSRRIVWSRLFGKNDEFLKQQIRAANVAGVPGPDLHRFQGLMNEATGRLTYKVKRDIQIANQQLHAATAAVLMPRSMWTSLAEPMNAAMATGDMRTAGSLLAKQFGEVFRTADSKERAEIADMIGVTTSSAYDSIMQSRTGAEYADSPATDRFMTHFYRATFLTQLTTSQRRAAVGTADWLLRKWSRDLLSTDTDASAERKRDIATRMFNELGLTTQGNNLRDSFANWMLSHDGLVPSRELQNSEFRGVYGTAIRRLADRMIQNPYKIDRPQISGVPILGLATQLMSFNYTYQKNILDPAWDRLKHSYERGYQRGSGGGTGAGAKAKGFAYGVGSAGRSVANAMLIVGGTILASMLTSIPRQYIFDQDTWDKHEKTGDLWNWLAGLAVSRSGISGTFDPLTQVYDNLRYQSDLSSLFQGAGPAWVLRNAKDLIMPWAGQAESPNANTQYYNQARAAYNLFMVPLEVLGLTMMNSVGGPWTKGLTSTAMQYLTSPQFANQVSEFLAGPKGSTLDTGGEDTDPAGAGVPGIGGLEEPDGKPTQPDAAAAGNLGNTALGFLDDVGAPMFKALEKGWKYLPAPVKTLGLGLAATAYGWHWWNEVAPWRDHPNAPTKP